MWFTNNFIPLLVFIFGAAVGSFLNVAIWRLPQGKTLGGRSACPHCQSRLRAGDMVPLLSFIWLRGKCRNCQIKISWRYFIIEFTCAALFLAAYLFIRPQALPEYLEFARILAAISVLIVVFVIDLEHFLILDKVLVFGGGLILALSLAQDMARFGANPGQWFSLGGLLSGFAAAAVFYLLWLVSHGKWMGLGDVKFVFVLGLILGWPKLWLALWLAVTMGAVVGLGLLAAGKKQLKSPLPFGTFLSLAAVLAIFYGPAIWQWYWSLFA